MEKLVPKDYGEQVGLFRSQIIGPIVHRALVRGELREALELLATQSFRPPGAPRVRKYSVPTLERWYYDFRRGGAAALVPRPRTDRGRARALSDDEKQLVCDLRREHPSASAELILRSLERRGKLSRSVVSATTVRRLLAERGLDRLSLRSASTPDRRRWEASHAGALWHGDVCHGPKLTSGPLRIHGMLDDASRYVVALEARTTEREDDMLGLLVAAIRRWGRPDGLYLDNGSTYSGDALATGCGRLGIALVHAKPYDPQARGKMERFWRTLREGVLDHLDPKLTHEDVQARLDTFLADHYHVQPHASLMGDSPGITWASRQTHLTEEDALVRALTVRERRRVSRDGVIKLGGRLFEVRQSFLLGRIVEVQSCLVEGLRAVATIRHDGSEFELRPLDVRANAKAERAPRAPETPELPFDPFAPNKQL